MWTIELGIPVNDALQRQNARSTYDKENKFYAASYLYCCLKKQDIDHLYKAYDCINVMSVD